jgi:hypothetical protein
MGHFYPSEVVDKALELIRSGSTITAAAADVGVPRNTVQRWKRVYLLEGRARGQAHCQVPCPRCTGSPLDEAAYAELLGWYLGDGHIARARRGVFVLRIYNDAQYVADNARILLILDRVKPGSKPTAHQRGQVVISTLYWKHWPCLFPQHGPGRKHEREIRLEPWQAAIVRSHPAAFLRGLFHSDGCRAANWTTRIVVGAPRRYDYPRWQFTNVSDDIRGLCGWALDLADIAWRQSNRKNLSVSRREAVARLEALIGLKS